MNESGKKIDINNINLELLKDKTVNHPGLIDFAHQVGSAIVKAEDEGKIKGKAVAAMHDQTHRQFQQLYGQMQTLINQAKALQKRVEISERIYLAKMNFDPVINHIYFLYKRANGTDILSMVSPEEWGKTMPFQYIAKVWLLSDHTWEVLEQNITEL